MPFMNFDANDKTPTMIDRLLRAPGFIFGIAVVLGILGAALLVAVWSFFGDPVRAFLGSQLGFSILMMVLALGIIISLCALCILFERKISAFIQDRKGPNRVGFWGLLQPMADGIKMFIKEEIIPASVDRPLFLLAPAFTFGISLLGFAVLPWAGEIQWPWAAAGETVTTQVARLDIGLLYILAIGSMAVYGVVLAGYSSNNKYAFYGGMRATAQMLSYEVPMGLALVIVLLTAGSLRPEVIVDQQAASGMWNVFYHPLAFFLLLVSAFAETNRAPFDLVECEQELVGGYHTEYSSMKLGMLLLGEYAHMIVASAIMVALFFGGWHLWFLPGVEDHTWLAALIKFAVYWTKICGFVAFFMVVRWTLPRFRFDQLMHMAWLALVPMGLALVIATGVLVVFGLERNIVACLIVNALTLIGALILAGRSTRPVTGRQDNLRRLDEQLRSV